MIIFILLTSFLFAQNKPNSSPIDIYNSFWKLINENYALFSEKKIDWELIKKIYRPMITNNINDDELFDVLKKMIHHLNDNHVGIIRNDSTFYYSGNLSMFKMNDFSLDLILSKYLEGDFKSEMDDAIYYGSLNDSIGYIYLKTFPGDYEKAIYVIDEALTSFKECKGIVIDVRNNYGGNDLLVQKIANRFTDKKRLFMISMIKNGQGKNEFTSPRYWQIKPEGCLFNTKPVILLTHRHSASSSENLALAMKVIPCATIIGDFTSGVFGGACPFTLPNGWKVFITFKKIVDHNNQCWEGIGVMPDIYQVNTDKDIQDNKDNILELAIKAIKSESLEMNYDIQSETKVKTSIPLILYNSLNNLSKEEAINQFRSLSKNLTNTYYLDIEEMWIIGDQLLEENKIEEANVVLSLIFETFRTDWSLSPAAPMWWYYIYCDKADFKEVIFKKALEITPNYIWQKKLQDAAIDYFHKRNNNNPYSPY